MAKQHPASNWSGWARSLLAAVVAALLVLAAMIATNLLGAALLACFVLLVLVVFLAVTAIATRARARIIPILLLVLSIGIGWYVIAHFAHLRTTARWIVLSHVYQRKVLAQSKPADGSLRHIVWDAFGFAGVADRNVYLVFDPSNELQGAALGKAKGRFAGIPCEVPLVTRLESQWYLVDFYVDTTWERCKPGG